MIGIFKENEERYLNWYRANPEGYVFNHFKGSDPDYNKIHIATCRTLWRQKDAGVRTKVEKICSSNLNELIQMTEYVRDKKGFSFCKICMTDHVIKNDLSVN
ncbi:hypothetical protein [Guptibacillus hwajinpoensis]|uniref:hypothetical protein n=1 Tax=Guptibacillus hwajinpoensis TaxID=208199 RepID=UPI001CFF4455|nr:hypothetical protein [Pseudalkalibacillus hwajinpoensis]WLR58637.1 hypothetical protein LC071_15870 [Pseudalkalibacillus hwajinpoensis]